MKKDPSNLSRPANGLAKDEILRGRKAFSTLFSGRAQALETRPVVLRFLWERSVASDCKMAFITPRRLAKAHHRNRMRRYLKEAYRCNKHALQAACEMGPIQFHGAFIVRRPGLQFSAASNAVQQLLDECLSKLPKPDTA